MPATRPFLRRSQFQRLGLYRPRATGLARVRCGSARFRAEAIVAWHVQAKRNVPKVKIGKPDKTVRNKIARPVAFDVTSSKISAKNTAMRAIGI